MVTAKTSWALRLQRVQGWVQGWVRVRAEGWSLVGNKVQEVQGWARVRAQGLEGWGGSTFICLSSTPKQETQLSGVGA